MKVTEHNVLWVIFVYFEAYFWHKAIYYMLTYQVSVMANDKFEVYQFLCGESCEEVKPDYIVRVRMVRILLDIRWSLLWDML